MKRKIIPLDELVAICGYFTGGTPVNNGYGCTHPKCEEKEIVRLNYPDSRPHDEQFKQKLFMIAMRKKYGSMHQIIEAVKTKDGKQYAIKVKSELIHDDSFLKQFGCKQMGKCYSFSCPVANEADLEDMKELDNELYNEWKDEEYDPCDAGGDYMIISGALIKKTRN